MLSGSCTLDAAIQALAPLAERIAKHAATLEPMDRPFSSPIAPFAPEGGFKLIDIEFPDDDEEVGEAYWYVLFF